LDTTLLLARQGIAGSDGTFRLFDLVPGRYEVSARLGFLRSAVADVALEKDGDAQDVRFVIPRGLALEGSVTDDGGRPLAGAWLLLFEKGGMLEIRSEGTDVNGRFRLEGLESKEYRLSVSRRTGGADDGSEESFARVDVDGLVPPRQDVVVRLPRRVFMQGRVVDEAGRPLARAVIDVVDGERRDYQAMSDDDGRFRLEVVAGARLDVSGYWQGPGAETGDGRQRAGKLTGVVAGAGEIVLALK
jgi:hypothetical protein